jgi:cell division protein FtsB
MKKNIWIVLSLIAVVALAAVVVKQNRQITQLKEQLASAAEKPKEPAIPKPEKAVAEPPAESKPVETAPALPIPEQLPTAQSNAGSTNNLFSGFAKMMKDPAMKDMVRAQQKLMLDRQYGSLSKYLNLPADRLDALKGILSDRQAALMDSGMAMMGGTEAERKQAVEDAKTIKSDYDKKIQDLLGTQNYPVFQDYEKTMSERMSVEMFKSSLSASDVLSDQQEDNLIALMYQGRKGMPALANMNNQNADPSQFTEESVAQMEKQMEQLQQRYADQAKTILTPAQLEQFTAWQKQFSTMQLAGLKMAAQMFGNKGTVPAPTSK